MNLSSVDLNLLFVLHTVLREKTVARAAEKLNVTPPAVSNALARLRDLLGDPLLVRRGRGFRPSTTPLESGRDVADKLGDTGGPASSLKDSSVACDSNLWVSSA